MEPQPTKTSPAEDWFQRWYSTLGSAPDLVELIHDHQRGAIGEIESMWGKLKPDEPDEWSLILRFEAPRTALAIIEFNAESNGLLVDMIMETQRSLLFPGEPGDLPSKCMAEGRPSMMMEVVATTDEWQLRWTDAICRKHNVSAEVAREIQGKMRQTFGSQYLE